MTVFVGKCQPDTQRNLSANNAVATVKILLAGEHMHGATLTVGIPGRTARKLCHHATGGHASHQHLPVVSVRCNQLIAIFQAHLDTNHHSFLPDIQVAETAN